MTSVGSMSRCIIRPCNCRASAQNNKRNAKMRNVNREDVKREGVAADTAKPPLPRVRPSSHVFTSLRFHSFRPLASRVARPLQSRPMRDPRLEKLADVLVNYSVGVKKDQVVRISGPPVAEPLIVELYRKVVAAGGHAFARMAPEELAEVFLKTASDEQLKHVNPIALFEGERIDCSIGIWGEENTKSLTNVDPRKIG